MASSSSSSGLVQEEVRDVNEALMWLCRWLDWIG